MTEPTDAELIALLGDRQFSSIGAVREALRRWGTPPAGAVPLTDEQLAEIMRETWGCASIAPRHAIGFARAVEAAHGIGIKGGQHGAE